MIGTGDATISRMISRVDVTSPPGVSRRSTTTAALSWRA
jgi:hypothetical protein